MKDSFDANVVFGHPIVNAVTTISEYTEQRHEIISVRADVGKSGHEVASLFELGHKRNGSGRLILTNLSKDAAQVVKRLGRKLKSHQD